MTDRKTMQQEFDRLSKDERHHTNAETLYWCQQYKLFAQKLLAQPEQEPVAWITPDGEGFRMRLEPPVNDVPLGWKALYTAPQSKQWVGLHLDDIPETFVGDWSFLQGAKLAEAKLKEKNT